MPFNTRIKLSAMMFLQFMMFAVWWVPLGAYLDNIEIGGTEKSTILSSMAFGCLVSPVIGMIADRHFNSEKVLFVLNLLGAVFLFLAANTTSFLPLFLSLLAAMLCYMPTWGLTSSIAMANSPAEKFPQIRVFGSIGWVCAAVFSMAAVNGFGVEVFDGTVLPMFYGAGVAVVGAFVALLLPKTPPPAKGEKGSIVDALGLRAFSLMKDRNFTVFVIVTMLVMVPFSIYWSYGSTFLQAKGFKQLTATMNLGQFAEMFFMLMVTLALKKMGMKWAMVTGLVALLVRYVAFFCGGRFDMPWLYFVAILVHGIIFGFFFVGGQIYINKKAPKELQAQAQGFIFLVSFGVGMLIGNYFNGWLIDTNITMADDTTTYDWNTIWGVTTVFSFALLAAFLVLFRDNPNPENPADAGEGAASA